ncbi:MAG: hypothetical protein DLM69_12280 [Candidatus Chloroheliales bacterium]|nr:MAG: hypothetical protein DLM69_12280 [Chloroflexota bacterium]
MGCPAYKDLLSRYIDNELSKREREELQAHLQVCSRCSHALAKYRQMEALLGSNATRPAPKPNPAVRDKVLAAIEEQQRHRISPLGGVISGHATRRFSIGRMVGLVAIVGAVSVTAVLLAQNPAARGLWGEVGNTAGEPSPSPDLALTSVARANATATAVSALPPAHITSYSLLNSQNQLIKPTEVPLDAAVALRFDAPMERGSIEQGWQISPPIPGSFDWVADNEVHFIPYNLGYIPAVTYTLSLSNSAHVMGGGSLAAPFTYTWTTMSPPALLDHTPGDLAAKIALDQGVTMHFSQPMQRESVQAAFNVNPSIAGKWAWSDDRQQATFAPDGGWQPYTRYSVTLGHNAASAAAVPLGRDISWQFVSVEMARVNFITAQAGPTLPIIGLADGAGRYDIPFSYTQPDGSIGQLVFQLFAVSGGDIKQQPMLKPLASSTVAINGATSYSGTVTLGLQSGVYLLAAPTGQQVYLIVSDEQVAAKQAGGQLLLWATRNGKPVVGQELQVYDAAHQLLDDGRSGTDGLYLTNLNAGATPALVLARDGNAARAVAFINGQPASNSNLRIYTYTDRAAYTAGDALNFKVVARSVAGTNYQLPPPDTSINMTLADTHGIALASVMLRPDSYGMVGGSFPLAPALHEGWYTLSAATMGQGQQLRVYVHQPGAATTLTRISETHPLTATEGSLSVTLDKSEYSVGETATLTISNAPAESAAALLTVERGSFILRRSGVISGSASLELPISAAMAPAARVQVSLLTSNGPISAGADLRVPLGRTLDVRLEPDANARPGRNAVFTVRVADHKGQPLPAALSLSVGNTAPDSNISATFYPTMVTPAPLYSVATLTDSLPRDGGGPGWGAEPSEKIPAATQLAYWGGNLLVGASGVATYSVALPADARGDWWATARVVGADDSFGQASVSFPLTAPLEVRPLAPASFVQGDRVNVGATLMNHTAQTVSGHITLSSDGLTFIGAKPAEQSVTIEAGQAQTITWRVQVRRARAVGMVFDFFADDASNKGLATPLDSSVDASAEVRPATPQQVSASAGMTTASATVTATLQSEPATDLSSIEIEVDPSIAAALIGSLGAELDAAAPGSEAMSGLAAEAAQLDDAFGRLQYSKAALPSFNEAASAAMQGVYTNQQPDGGWGDRGAGSDIWATAFTLHNLARIRDAGPGVDSQVTARAVAWLRQQLPQMNNEQRAYSYYVLALFNAADLSEVRPLLAQPLDHFGTAALILALQRLGDHAAAVLLAHQLSAAAVLLAHQLSAAATVSDGELASWQSDAVGSEVATATAVEALLQTVPSDPFINRGVSKLLAMRVGRHWETARASSAAFAALLNYAIDSNDGRGAGAAVRVNEDVPSPVQPSHDQVGGYSYKLYLNDTLLTEVGVDPSNPSAGHRLIVLPADKLQTKNIIRLVGSGGNSLYYAVTTRYRHSISASFTASDDDARRFSLQNPRAIPSNGSDSLSISRSYENLDRPAASDIAVGDKVRVTLKVQVGKDAAPLHQVVVNDQLAAGFTLLGPEQAARPMRSAVSQSRPDGGQSDDAATADSQYASFSSDAGAVSFLVAQMQPGASYTFSYLAQATVSGDFAALPSMVYPIEQPDNAAASASNLISISAPNSKGQQ